MILHRGGEHPLVTAIFKVQYYGQLMSTGRIDPFGYGKRHDFRGIQETKCKVRLLPRKARENGPLFTAIIGSAASSWWHLILKLYCIGFASKCLRESPEDVVQPSAASCVRFISAASSSLLSQADRWKRCYFGKGMQHA